MTLPAVMARPPAQGAEPHSQIPEGMAVCASVLWAAADEGRVGEENWPDRWAA